MRMNGSMDENKRKKKHRVLPFLLVIAAVAAVVVFAAYRDGTGLDVLRRHFSYGGSQESGAVRFTYDPSAKNRCAAVGDGQAERDGCMMRFYLTSYGRYADFIGGLLQSQRVADSAAFQTVLEEFYPEQQSALLAAIA